MAAHSEVACRPHDECNGSDVFGTDICTCRPYLAYAIQDAVETAQRGGVGIIAYYRKEGRALGEVTKFRVYNSRKYQVMTHSLLLWLAAACAPSELADASAGRRRQTGDVLLPDRQHCWD